VIERVVTLGDSYSSGQGIHDDADQYDDHGPPAHSFDPDTRLGGSTCHRETDTTPGPLLAEQLRAASIFVACSGAVIAEIDNQLAVAGIPGDGAGTLVTMTIGGNDLRTGEGYDWPTALLECITSFGCNDDEGGGLDNLDVVEDDLRALYTGMGERYPSAHVRVLAYPSLMQADRSGCVGVVGVGRAEADWIDGQEALFVERIERAVTAAAATTGADLRFVGVDDAFDNHGACRTFGRDRYVRSIVRGTTLSRSMDPNGEVVEHRDDGVFTISPASFHPSQRGYDAFYEVLVESLPAGVTIRSD
jgi:hypothetical protein